MNITDGDDQERINELVKIMHKYHDAGKKIPTELFVEYNRLCDLFDQMGAATT